MVNFLRFLSSRKSPARGPAVSGAPIADDRQISQSASLAQSTLLKDVLAEGSAADALSEKVEDKTFDAPPLSQRLNVGSRLSEVQHRAIEAAGHLGTLVDEETAQMLGAIVQDLEQRVCRVAFAGQMNAGKSSLINVLVEQAELLPADINPWTTVVTKLHFGVPGTPVSGASFIFFTLDEWQRLSIGGRTRELTERIFPDFDWEALNAHVEAMQSRAEQKLGPRFQELLGTEHSYPAITSGLLNRYVGAGLPERTDDLGPFEGEFSDITKLANVFFDLGAFNFPTILVDTPGVNDPFLVRDEITRQSLGEADICVIVLTARQPLSTADLSLLRMLRGLNKSRLIIFINKIDEIDGSDAVLREVSQRVSSILEEEFPSAHIPIVCGSALWARTVLFPNRSAIKSSNDNVAAGRIREAIGSAAAQYWPDHDDIADTLATETLFQKSGLPSLALAISELMRGGSIAEAIVGSTDLIDAVSQNFIACLETEIDILSKVLVDRELAAEELAELGNLQATLSNELNVFHDRLSQNYTEKVTILHQTLIESVQNYISEHFGTIAQHATLAQLSNVDLKLRVKLENTFLNAFGDAAQSVLTEQEQLKKELTASLEQSGIAIKFAMASGDKMPLTSQPSLSALSEPAALGLATSFVEIATKPLSAEEQNAYFSGVIAADFEPIVDRLASEAARALHEMSANMTQQMRTLTLRQLETAVHRVSGSIQKMEAAADTSTTAQDLLQLEIDTRREVIAKIKRVQAANHPSQFMSA
jgi:tRNA U34 5-carboxymethylaminomethyl modifying GTPase MnmE/TrmE